MDGFLSVEMTFVVGSGWCYGHDTSACGLGDDAGDNYVGMSINCYGGGGGEVVVVAVVIIAISQ